MAFETGNPSTSLVGVCVCVWGGVLFQRIGLRTRNPVFQTVQKSACTVHFEATQARFAAAGQEQAWGFAITGGFFWWLAVIWGSPPIVTDNCQYI